jgi:hypothetical protein
MKRKTKNTSTKFKELTIDLTILITDGKLPAPIILDDGCDATLDELTDGLKQTIKNYLLSLSEYEGVIRKISSVAKIDGQHKGISITLT